MLESTERFRKQLKEDTAVDFVFMTCPEWHGFKAGATIENYEAIAIAIEREVVERYMPRPVDADGVLIHIGDMMTDGVHKFKVYELAVFDHSLWIIRNKDGNTWAACDLTHCHEPTVEDVLQEFADSLYGATDKREETFIIAEYAKKLHLAGDNYECD